MATLEQGLPANVDAERSILGVILLNNDAYNEAAEVLKASDFSLDSHRRIYAALGRLIDTGRNADIVTLAEELSTWKEIESIGGVAYLAGLTEGLPRKLLIDEYIHIVKDKSLLRQLMSVFSTAMARAADQSDSALDVLNATEAQLMKVSENGSTESFFTIADIDAETDIKKKRAVSCEREALELTWAVKGLDEFTHGAFKGEFTVVAGEPGGGKLMDVEEIIPTPTGFKRNGDLRDGDEVFGDDGRVYQVLKAHPVQEEEAFRIRFDDGTETFVHSGHLWYTWTVSDKQKRFKQSLEFRENRRKTRKDGKGKGVRRVNRDNVFYSHIPPAVSGSVKTTLEIINTLTYGGRANHSIPLAKPLEIPYRKLPIDPYVLGAWLGDGTSSKPEITIGREDEADMCSLLAEHGHMVRKLPPDLQFAFGPPVGKGGRSKFRKILVEIGVLNNKHIPEIYFWSSYFQRLELLRGLMDTDGCCNADGQVEFTNTKYELSAGVYRLAASLGVKPYWDEGVARIYGKDCGPKYRVKWTDTLDCFYLRRKRGRLPKKKSERTKCRYIISIDPVGKKKMRCITTSNPSGLYLFGANCNVTHNTSYALQMLLANAAEGTPGCFFSMEMTKEQVKKRCYPLLSEILTANHIRDPRLMNLHTHVPEMEKITQRLAELPLYIDDTRQLSIDKLILKMRMMRRKFNIKLFVVDYLQLIAGRPRMNEFAAFKDIVFSLRDFPTLEPDCALVVLSQYSKSDGFTKSKKRTRDSLYGGSVIQHTAQNIFMISIEDPEKRDEGDLLDAEFRIAKQRDGKCGKVTCVYDSEHYKFTYMKPILQGV